MTRLLKSSFLWQFAGGFVLGAIGVGAVAVQHEVPSTPAAVYAQR
jgi:hypothetical protein